jgi:type II secretory pathway component PulK
MTLFVVALVTILVLEYHFDATVEMDLAANYAGDVQAYHLAMAGLRFAQALLQRDDPKADGPDDSWYKLGLLPACFSPQQLIELATAGLGGGASTEERATRTAADAQVAGQPSADIGQGGPGCVSLRITDENSKLPINALIPPNEGAPPPAVWVNVFQRFFESFKIDPEIVDALIDWIDPDDNPRGTSGAETSYYQSLPVPYVAPNGRMRTPGELRQVKGLNDAETLAQLFPGATPEAVADLDLGSNPYLTPFGAEQTPAGTPAGTPSGRQAGTPSGRQAGTPAGTQTGNQAAKVNVNTASLEILKALLAGVRSDRSNVEGVAEEIIEKRQEKQLTKLDEAVQDGNLRRALSSVADVKSTYFRIESVGVVGLVQKKVVAVLKRGSQQASTANPADTAGQMTMLYFKVE